MFASLTCSVRSPKWSSIAFFLHALFGHRELFLYVWCCIFPEPANIIRFIYTWHRFQFFALSVHNLSWVLVLCFKLVYLFNWSWKVDSFIVYAIVSVLANCLFTMWLMTCYVYIFDQITPTRSFLWPADLNFTIYLLGQCILQILLIFLLRLTHFFRKHAIHFSTWSDDPFYLRTICLSFQWMYFSSLPKTLCLGIMFSWHFAVFKIVTISC